jgi:katanin p60 ATPase-containing subunit A1
MSPWRGVLLYGPPGTGKTMLAKAVATECSTTFFNISASSIVSKYRGDSEKLVRILFELARYHAPSTIFLDEIDSIMGQRDGNGEHEASRRMKTELLIQMDGLARNNAESGASASVFVLAASNLPWALDAALLRRLEKRVMVPLPELEGRRAVFAKQLPEDDPRTDDVDYDYLAAHTEGYSCADCCLVAKEAAMYPVRRLMAQLEEFEELNREINAGVGVGVGGRGGGRAAPARARRGKVQPPPDLKLGPVTNGDAVAALAATKKSAVMHEAMYAKWQSEFGAV